MLRICAVLAIVGSPVLAAEPAPMVPAESARSPALVTSRDPYVGFNRAMYDFNIGFDRLTLRPTARLYRRVMPETAKRGVTSALHNLQEPLNVINSLLQGKPNRAFNALGRFLINSTVGFAGFNDLAAQAQMPRYREDFGQTLASWGVPSGPYLMLPFLGPSNPRDFTGFIVEFLGDPASLAISREISPWASRGATGMYFLDVRQRALATVDKVLDTSTDPYTALQSAYIQRRNFDLLDGNGEMEEQANDPFEDANSPPAPASPKP